MPAIVSGYPNVVIVLHDERNWCLLQCVLIFASTYVARSSLCAPITVRSGGNRSFTTVMAC